MQQTAVLIRQGCKFVDYMPSQCRAKPSQAQPSRDGGAVAVARTTRRDGEGAGDGRERRDGIRRRNGADGWVACLPGAIRHINASIASVRLEACTGDFT